MVVRGAMNSRPPGWAQQLASIPSSQLAAMKLIVNQTYENMGLNSTQILGPILDGLMRNTPDEIDFIRRAEQDGGRPAITARDGPFRDYSQADANERPNPNHVISI
jgi:enoyl-CoA hydratase